ncbi:hypothetical protein PSACC_02969 [Paramicrosporidium saccamoebae]|uniref:Uncharacterized protein n=1 Tax=Paramicrosporidium saccamoebae TaxID=1246581 RepID=A0A2H9THI5_9FUNG|nr:hypothetical protein PSACC_02969 [Paramicrosporidium saccamoebae]
MDSPLLLREPPIVPAFTSRLFPNTIALWNESKLLARLLYKTKNQHRAGLYYHRMQQVMRVLKCMAREEVYLQACWETGAEYSVNGMELLCAKLKRDCGKAYILLEHVYSEAYFVPLAVTGMAMLARLHACALLVESDLDKTVTRIEI